MNRNDLYNIPARLPLFLTETVTFQSRNADDTFTSYILTRALRKVIHDTEQLASGALVSITLEQWRIPQQSLDKALNSANGVPAQAPRPKPDDQIVNQAGTIWIINDKGVETIENNGLAYEHRCNCSKVIT